MLFRLLLLFALTCPTARAFAFYDKSDSLKKKKVVVGEVSFSGNKKTRPDVLYRELTFKENDTITVEYFREAIERSRQNLFNTSIFNFVYVDTISLDSNNCIDVKYHVKERWYIWPIPIFEVYEPNFNTWWETRNLDRASYGMYLVYNNFRGRRELLILKLRMGYSEQYGLTYSVPFLNKKKTIGLDISTAYSRVREVLYGTSNNKRLFLKYPEKYIRQDYYSALTLKYRHNLYTTQSFSLNYTQAAVDDTLRKVSNDYLANNNPRMELMRINYYFKHDMRDIRQYPLKGHYMDAEIIKLGLGILPAEKVDMWVLTASFRKYWKLHERIYLANGIKLKATRGKQPYYLQKGLGYNDYVRGYEYYIIDGQQYGVLKNALRYQLIKPTTKKLDFLPAEKFNTFYYALYAGLFADIGYVQDKYYSFRNPLANQWLYGYGAGMDIVTYYDIVARFEFTLNKMNRGGFYIHFIAPI